jgi:hypothetical protein
MSFKNNKKPAWKENLELVRIYLSVIPRDFAEFFSLIFKPYSLISTVITIGLIYFSQKQESGIFRSVLEIVAALSASIAGSLISESYFKARGNLFIIKKSTSAIRGLQLIKFKVNNITDRLNQLTNKDNKRDADEINNLVQNVHKDILNSIKDWSDVNPEAGEITDFYDILAQKEAVIKRKNLEKRQLEEQISKSDIKQTTEVNDLKKQLETKKEEIFRLKNQLNDFTVANYNLAQGSSSPSISPLSRFSGPEELVNLYPLDVGPQSGYVANLGELPRAEFLSGERKK